ncbi:MAG TPA: hypothetical protein VN873_03830 [Candidatus Angelobacter sp.]|nr:hypothetical protein [Candidatus Angelobacter sp.]
MRAFAPKILTFAAASFVVLATALRADQVQMRNGDRYAGRILFVASNSIVMESDVLGKVTLPRDKVSAITFGSGAATNAIPSIPIPRASANGSQISADRSPVVAAGTTNLVAAFQNLGANTNFIQQVREQMLTGANPAANQKYNELLGGLMSGQISVDDLRGQAKTAIGQINQLKTELGPQADESLDAYLSILQDFVNEATPTAPATRTAPPAASFKTNSAPARPNQ